MQAVLLKYNIVYKYALGTLENLSSSSSPCQYGCFHLMMSIHTHTQNENVKLKSYLILNSIHIIKRL